MRIKSTLAWGLLMLASATGGILTGGQGVTWYQGGDGTYGAYAGVVGVEYDAGMPAPRVAVWACPEGVGEIVPAILACPVDLYPATVRQRAESGS